MIAPKTRTPGGHRADAALAHGTNHDSTADAHDRKAFANLRALAALLGWRLERDGANCALIRWNRALHCADLPAVQAALARIGGTK